MKEKLGLVGLGVVLGLLVYQLLDQGTLPPSVREQETASSVAVVPLAPSVTAAGDQPAERKPASFPLH